ncbi:MAG: hypothetical protein IJW00_06295 [Clostridia bacterium]|nr:hypothetical protein [Clostridia bacterium]
MFNEDYTIRRPTDFDYNAAIAELEEQVSRKKYVTTQLAYFKAEVARLTRLEEQRRTELTAENADVVRLQKISPALILYTITGKKADMIAKEEAEALAAAARYETVKNELDYAESRMRELSAELRRLGNCDRKLDEMIEEKKQKCLAEDSEFSAKTAELERAVKAYDLEIKEIEQALDKGSRVRGIIRGIYDHLDRAHELSEIEMGSHRRYGSIMLDDEKHRCIDSAQALLRHLGQYMQEFAAELDDVVLDEVYIPTSVGIHEGTRLLDVYFDNIFTDYAVCRKIEGSQAEMDDLLTHIEPVLEGLVSIKSAKENERALVAEDLKRLIQQNG